MEQFPSDGTDFAELGSYGAGSFNSELKKLMVDYGTTKAGKEDAISNVQNEIDNVRGIMSKNIESILERGERIDLLVDKTDRLGGSAHDFRVRSRGLRRAMVCFLFYPSSDPFWTPTLTRLYSGGKT